MINSIKIPKLVLIIAILFAFSCKDEFHDEMMLEQKKVNDSINATVEGKASKIPNDKFKTIIYEDCEYLIYKEVPDNNKALGFMAHKGNCSNPIHGYSLNENP